MRPMSNRTHSNASPFASKTAIPDGLTRIRRRGKSAAARPVNFKLSARLLVTLIAIAFVATILTATAYMKDSAAWAKQENQEAKKQQPAATNGEGPLEIPYTGPVAFARLDPAATELKRLFKDGLFNPQAVNNYAVTRTTGITFSSISGTGTSVTTWRNGTSLDDNLSNNQPIGFPFLYNGGAYQNFRVSTNGFITFNTSSTATGGTVSTPYNYENVGLSSSSVSTNFSPLVLAPMWDDLTVPAAGTLSGNIKYLTTGVSPNRILTVEFIGLETFGNAGPDLNFQTKLYEVDGHIEYVYGTMSASTSTYTYSTGLNASTVSTTPTAAELLTQQTANTATFSNTPQNALTTIPATNTQLTFTPPATTPAAATNLTFPTIGSSFVTLNWTDNATNEINYNVLISTDGGTTYQAFGAIFGANTTGITVTGLTASTTYFFRVLACTEGVCSTPLDNSVTTNAAVSGTKTIGPGGDYPTFALAISDVNAGVGGAGVTFNVTSATTFPENGTCITGGALATPVVFQKSGAGANPIIQPPGSASTQDSGICILGGDYITFDGIDVAVAGGNTTVEYGALVFNSSATNGAQNNTIKNSKITLDRTNTGSIGINQTLSIAATAASGANSTNKYYNITVENAYKGILLNGTSTAFPDLNCEIGITGGGATTIGAATANDIGNGSLQSYGIRATSQSGVKIFNAEVRNVTVTSSVLSDGIFLEGFIGTNDVYNNKVHDIRNSSTSATTGISGIRATHNTTGTNVARIYNNFIYSITSGYTGAASTTRQIKGINVNGTSGSSSQEYDVDFNSVRLDGSASPNISSTCFEIASTTPVNKVRDNIFANFTGAQTTSKHFTWVSTSNTSIGGTGSVSNNNDLYVSNTTNGFIGTGSSTDRATLAAWQTGYTQDANSISSDPLFFSATDLHIPTGSPAVNAGSFFAGAITWAGTDIDAQTRPNGATNPDIGADEFYTSPGSVQFSSATYGVTETGVTATITATRTGGSNGAASVNYATSNGTATGGASCTAGVDYISTSGTLNWADLDSASKTFTVSICNDGVPESSETVNLALSTAVTASLGTPNTAVLTITNAADVFNGSVNVGSGQAYTSLTNAGGVFDNINNGTVTGNTTVNITSDLTSETGAVALNQFAAGFTLTIKPSGAARIVSGSATSALIKLNGADNVTIDGSTTGGSDRSLTINNTNATGTAVIWLSSLGTGLGATNDTVKNATIIGGADTSTSTTDIFGIISSGTTVSTSSDGADNDTNTFDNNAVTKVRWGIYVRGAVANANDNNTIIGNLVGSTAFDTSRISKGGIVAQHQNAINITRNEVRFVGILATDTAGGTDRVGIGVGDFGWTPTTTAITSATVTRNSVHDIVEEKTFSAVGIVLGPSGITATNNLVANNMIYNVRADGTSGDQGLGIGIASGDGDKVVFNSISLTGDIDPGTSSTATQSEAGVRISSATATNLTFKNNAISVDQTSNTSTLKHYAFVKPSATYSFGTGGSDYSDYFVNAINTQTVLFGNGTSVPYSDVTTLTAFKAETPAHDQNAKVGDPLFTSATDLHINPATAATSPVNNAGTSITGVTDDFDAPGIRTTSTPDIGADEFSVNFSSSGSTTLAAGTYDSITVNSPDVVTLGGNITVNSFVLVNSGGTLNMGTFTVSGAATFTLNSGGTLGIGSAAGIATGGTGNVQVAGTRTFSTGGNYTYNGSAAQVTGNGLPATVNNLTINNASGVTLTGDVSVSSTFTLTSGNVDAATNSKTLTVGPSGTVSRTSGHVLGNLKKTTVPSSFTFDVGTANGYSPLTLSSVSGSGDFTVSATQSTMPGVVLTGKALARYWSLTNSGLTSAVVSFKYLDADVPGTSTEANYRIFKDTNGSGSGFTFPDNGNDDVDDATNTATTLSAVSTFSNWSVAEPNAPTAVKLMKFAATNYNGEVTLQWQSGYEAHNLGYVVYREQNGRRTQITPSMIAGSALTTGQQTVMNGGVAYAWTDRVGRKEVGSGQKAEGNQQSAISSQQSAVTYWLEDVDLDGTRTLHGPITPSIAYTNPKGGPQRSALLNELQNRTSGTGTMFRGWPAVFAAQQAAFSNPRVVDPDATIAQRQIAAMPGVKLAVSTNGLQRIGQPELVAAGLDPNVNAPQLQLYANGRAVPIKLSGDQVHFTAGDYLEFYGHGLESTTEAAQTYYLVVRPDSFGSRIQDLVYRDPQPLPPPTGAQNYQYTIERKDRWIYYSAYLNGDDGNIFGHVVQGTPVSETLPVNHVDATGGDAELEVSLVGLSLQSHHVRVSFNGTDLGIVDFAGADHPIHTFSVPAALVHDGDNAVQFVALDGSIDASLVDSVRLTYAHAYAADNNLLSVGIDNEQTRRIGGFTSANVRVLDITDPRNVVEITQTVAVSAQPDGTFAADMQVQGASFRQTHTLLAFVDGQGGHPDIVKSNEPSSWWSQTAGADYLIITSRDFKTNVEPLAQLRRNQGMVVKVVDVEDLYDEFSYGQHTPQAVHDFLQLATSTWTRQPHYVLFAGDASFDPKNYLGQGNTDYVPTKLVDTALMETASDDWLADFDNDGMADLAIGRLPVRTSADADLMVSKIINYENATPDPQRGALMVADHDFESSSTAVQSLLPASMPQQVINRSSADDTTIHNQIISSLNQGPSVVNFMGHGGNGTWTGALLLSIYDAPNLTNNNRLSLFVMMTCMNGYFQNAYNDSLSEALMRTPGGAVAVWSSSGMTGPEGQNTIDQEFYRQLFGGQGASTRLGRRGLLGKYTANTGPTLGDAARAAKQTTNDTDVRRTWMLFGDPAMRLR
ncbi:MAG: hypothetical protein JWM21_4085 [Acidobacteria bacterium]|nr:hypothetical protein [Acidobacteriota bacterium]